MMTTNIITHMIQDDCFCVSDNLLSENVLLQSAQKIISKKTYLDFFSDSLQKTNQVWMAFS